MAWPPRSPVRMRMHSFSSWTKIFPSPTSPAPCRAVRMMVSTVMSSNASLQAMVIWTLGIRLGTIFLPRWTMISCWRPWPLTRVTVMRSISASIRASRTSSSFSSGMMAVMSFIGASWFSLVEVIQAVSAFPVDLVVEAGLLHRLRHAEAHELLHQEGDEQRHGHGERDGRPHREGLDLQLGDQAPAGNLGRGFRPPGIPDEEREAQGAHDAAGAVDAEGVQGVVITRPVFQHDHAVAGAGGNGSERRGPAHLDHAGGRRDDHQARQDARGHAQACGFVFADDLDEHPGEGAGGRGHLRDREGPRRLQVRGDGRTGVEAEPAHP